MVGRDSESALTLGRFGSSAAGVVDLFFSQSEFERCDLNVFLGLPVSLQRLFVIVHSRVTPAQIVMRISEVRLELKSLRVGCDGVLKLIEFHVESAQAVMLVSVVRILRYLSLCAFNLFEEFFFQIIEWLGLRCNSRRRRSDGQPGRKADWQEN